MSSNIGFDQLTNGGSDLSSPLDSNTHTEIPIFHLFAATEFTFILYNSPTASSTTCDNCNLGCDDVSFLHESVDKVFITTVCDA